VNTPLSAAPGTEHVTDWRARVPGLLNDGAGAAP